MFTVNAKLLFLSVIGAVAIGLLAINQEQLAQKYSQLKDEVGTVMITPVSVVTPPVVVTASPSATPTLIVKTPVRVATPVISQTVVK